MAIPFSNGNFERPRGGTGFIGTGFSNGGNDNGFSGGGGRGGGYTFDPCIDSSVRSRLSEQGYLLQTVGSASPGGPGEYILNYPQSTLSTPAGSIPIFVSPSGQQYVLDCTNRTTYQLTRLERVPPPPPPPLPPVPPVPPVPPPLPPVPPVPPTSVPNLGGVLGSGKIYTMFNSDDIVPNQQEIVTRALWTNNVGNLLTFYTSSAQTAAQKEYYYEVYNSSSAADCSSEAQFSVAYGHRLGSGSEDEGGQIEDTPSRATYGQYRLLCLNQDETAFVFNGSTADSIYAINVNRARMREALDQGNIEVNIAALSGSIFIASSAMQYHTGSNVKLKGDGAVIRLIDDSSIAAATIKQSGEVYNMVSGTIEDGIYNASSPVYYGQLFKRKGIIILDGAMLDASASFGTVTSRETNGDNSYKLFTAMSGAAQFTDASGDYLGFQGRSEEKVKSTHYFVRVKNADYNFSNNPTFVTGSEGDLRHAEMYTDPKVYVTGVGLYNNEKDLVAVAKLSQAVKKSFKEEALIKIKLDF